jgi:hypothetical protein
MSSNISSSISLARNLVEGGETYTGDYNSSDETTEIEVFNSGNIPNHFVFNAPGGVSQI